MAASPPESMSQESYPSSFAVFPFLKTREPIAIGGLTFRSTADASDLGPDDAQRMAEIAAMLFLKDDRRIHSSSYAALPYVDLDNPGGVLWQLDRLQAIVAYCYSAPHLTLGDPFFRYEDASLVIFSPARVFVSLVRPEELVDQVGSDSSLVPDRWGHVQGYHGLYNFKQHFWVANGSRVYPPVPQMALNGSQDLSMDLRSFFAGSLRYQLLPAVIESPPSALSDRILTSIKWFNAANSFWADEEAAIVNMAVAFETLLELSGERRKPEERKKDPLADSVSLLLGRVPRLDDWVRQFYEARNEIVHKGRADRLRHFIPSSSKGQDGQLYRSLLSFGREVFQACVGALAFGARIGQKYGLAEKLITNQERFEEINRTLDAQLASPAEGLRLIADRVEAINRYRLVGESALTIKTMLACVRRAAQALLACDASLEPLLKDRLERVLAANLSPDSYEVLEALAKLAEITLKAGPQNDSSTPKAITFRLVNVVWHYTFMNYFSLKRRREQGPRSAS